MRRYLAVIVVSVLFLTTLWLGIWQLDRARQKVAIVAQIQEQAALPVAVLDATSDLDVIEPFRRLRVRGNYLAEKQVLLDNRIQQGRVGYEVITAMQIEDSDNIILVNRGWVPLNYDRRILPDIRIDAAVHWVVGRARLPSKNFILREKQFNTMQWEPVWQNLELDVYQRLTSLLVAPFYLELDDEAPYGFERRWVGYTDRWIARHRGYAVQWFALGITLLLLSGFFYQKQRRKENDDTNDK